MPHVIRRVHLLPEFSSWFGEKWRHIHESEPFLEHQHHNTIKLPNLEISSIAAPISIGNMITAINTRLNEAEHSLLNQWTIGSL